MVTENLLTQIREGMRVMSSDGKKLGKIRRLHARDTDAYLEVASEGDLWKIWQLELKLLFLPLSVVAGVVGQRVHLTLDAKTAKGCRSRPTWIPQEILPPISGGGGG